MKLDLNRIAAVAAEEQPEQRITTERITKREVRPGSDIEKVRRAIQKIPQIKSRADVDRSAKALTLSMGDATITLDFQTGRFKVT